MNKHKHIFRAWFLRAVFGLLLLSSVSRGAYAEKTRSPAEPLPLRKALENAFATNPELGTARENQWATGEALHQGRALFLPSLDLNADTGYERSDDPATRAGPGSDTETHYRYETGLTLTQLLFDGWKSRFEVDRQKARLQSATHRVRETAEMIGLSIVEAYLEVMYQRRLLVISQQNITAHVDIMKHIQDAVSAGRSTRADLEQVKARLASARAQKASTLQSLKNAEADYRRNVGQAPPKLTPPDVPYGALAEDVEKEVAVSLEQSPALDVFKAGIEAAYAEAQQAKSGFYPQMDIKLNARQGRDINGVEGRDTSASALLTMNWNLYRGGADAARAREFSHRHRQSKEEYADALRNLERDVRQSWAGKVSAGERQRQFTAQAKANREVVKSYKDQFSLNRRTLLDVLDAQNELFLSRSSAVTAEYLEMFAVFRLLALKGELLRALDLEYLGKTILAVEDTRTISKQIQAR